MPIPNMPRPLTARERLTDWLFVSLQYFSKLGFIVLGFLGYFVSSWIGVGLGVFGGLMLGYWIRRSMGLRGSNANDAYFIRMKERAEGSTIGLLERVLESLRGNVFTQAKCCAITAAHEEAVRKMQKSTTPEERHLIIEELDRKVKAVSYGQGCDK